MSVNFGGTQATVTDSATIKVQTRAETFRLKDLVARAAHDWANGAREKGLALISHTGEFPPGALEGHPGPMRQAIDILLENAVRHTQSGSVSLDCRAGPLDGNRLDVTIRVGDTGPGVADAQQALMFSGVDLSRFEQLVQAVGGSSGVDSMPGRGTLVWFTVPLRFMPKTEGLRELGAPPPRDGLGGLLSGHAREVAAAAVSSVDHTHVAPARGAEADYTPAATPGGRRARLLLVDDTPMNQTVLSALLLRSGYRLEVVDNGPAALAATEGEVYDLILMDLRMPGMDGIETALRIRARGDASSRTPILAMTADDDPDQLDKAIKCGMDGVITKPVSRKNLIAGVEQALAASADQEQRREAI